MAEKVWVDRQRRLLGIVTQSDFFRAHRVNSRRVNGAVRDLMTRAVVTARADQPIVDLAQAFSDGGLHHVPVLDAGRRVVGMVTQSDLVAALLHNTGVATAD